jgi:hypothetical protein
MWFQRDSLSAQYGKNERRGSKRLILETLSGVRAPIVWSLRPSNLNPIQFFLSVSPATVNPLKPNDLYRRRAVSPLQIKIHSKNMREKPTNTPIIHSVY